jgi:hypothetical protein
MVQLHPGSLLLMGLQVFLAAGKEEGRDQIPNGPSTTENMEQIDRAARPTGRLLACNQEIGVRGHRPKVGRARPLNKNGLMVQREDIRLAV